MKQAISQEQSAKKNKCVIQKIEVLRKNNKEGSKAVRLASL